jgi:hypothetical protein
MKKPLKVVVIIVGIIVIGALAYMLLAGGTA